VSGIQATPNSRFLFNQNNHLTTFSNFFFLIYDGKFGSVRLEQMQIGGFLYRHNKMFFFFELKFNFSRRNDDKFIGAETRRVFQKSDSSIYFELQQLYMMTSLTELWSAVAMEWFRGIISMLLLVLDISIILIQILVQLLLQLMVLISVSNE
jgi:hypothetical protein